MYVYTHIYMYAFTHVCIHICIYLLIKSIYIYIYVYSHTFARDVGEEGFEVKADHFKRQCWPEPARHLLCIHVRQSRTTCIHMNHELSVYI